MFPDDHLFAGTSRPTRWDRRGKRQPPILGTTHQVKFDVVQSPSAGRGAKLHLPPRKSKRLGDADRKMEDSGQHVKVRDLSFGGGGNARRNSRERWRTQRLRVERQRDGIKILIYFEQQWVMHRIIGVMGVHQGTPWVFCAVMVGPCGLDITVVHGHPLHCRALWFGTVWYSLTLMLRHPHQV